MPGAHHQCLPERLQRSEGEWRQKRRAANLAPLSRADMRMRRIDSARDAQACTQLQFLAAGGNLRSSSLRRGFPDMSRVANGARSTGVE